MSAASPSPWEVKPAKLAVNRVSRSRLSSRDSASRRLSTGALPVEELGQRAHAAEHLLALLALDRHPELLLHAGHHLQHIDGVEPQPLGAEEGRVIGDLDRRHLQPELADQHLLDPRLQPVACCHGVSLSALLFNVIRVLSPSRGSKWWIAVRDPAGARRAPSSQATSRASGRAARRSKRPGSQGGAAAAGSAGSTAAFDCPAPASTSIVTAAPSPRPGSPAGPRGARHKAAARRTVRPPSPSSARAWSPSTALSAATRTRSTLPSRSRSTAWPTARAPESGPGAIVAW